MKLIRFIGSFLTLLSLSLFFAPTEGAFAGSPVTLTFDDLPGPYIPAGYGGLQWSNFFVLSFDQVIPSGFSNGMVSAPKVAFNASGNPAVLGGTTFDLNSAYVTGGWNDGLQVEVKGFVGSTLTYDNTWTVNSTAPTLVDFNYLGITSAEFISSGGVPHGYSSGGSGTEFAMDNQTITVPEPSTLALAGLGAAALITFRRRRD